jgi:hypothetical protein
MMSARAGQSPAQSSRGLSYKSRSEKWKAINEGTPEEEEEALEFLPRKTALVNLEELGAAFLRAAGAQTDIDRPTLVRLLDEFFGPRGVTESIAARGALPRQDRVSWKVLRDAVRKGRYRRRVPFATRLYALLDDPGASHLSRAISLFVMVLIVMSSISFILETMPAFRAQRWCVEGKGVSGTPNILPSGECAASAEPGANPTFGVLEAVCIACFTAEYLLRLLSAHAAPLEPGAAMAHARKQEGAGAGAEEEERSFMGRPKGGKKAGGGGGGGGGDGENEALADFVAHQELHELPGGAARTWAFVVGFANLIDLVAILPFYIALVVSDGPGGLSVLRVLRLARIFRIFKLGKYNEGMQMYGRVVGNSTSAFSLLLFFFSILMILFGSVIYSAEMGEWFGPGEDCPSSDGAGRSNATCAQLYGGGVYLRPVLVGNGGLEPTPFVSIVHGFWWVIVTCTTVGYGDLYPTTTAGKFVGFVAIPMGIVVIALPILIVANNFTAEYYAMQERADARLAKKEIGEFIASSKSLAGVAAAKAKVVLRAMVQRAERNQYFVMSAPDAPDALPPDAPVAAQVAATPKHGSRKKPRRSSAVGFAVYRRGASEDLDTFVDVNVAAARDRLVHALSEVTEPGTAFVVRQIDALANVANDGRSPDTQDIDEVLFCVLAFVSRSAVLSDNNELRQALLTFCAACCSEESTEEPPAGKVLSPPRRGSQRRVSRIFSPGSAALDEALKAAADSGAEAEA